MKLKLFILCALAILTARTFAITANVSSQFNRSGPGVIISENLQVLPYTEAGEDRVQFSYRLNDSISHFGNNSVSGWLTIDVAQTYDLNDDLHEIRIGLASLDDPGSVSQGFWGHFNLQPLDELIWYVTTDALLAGQSEFHIMYQYMVTGDLWFSQDSQWGPYIDSNPFICIECGLDMYLNLLFMDFSTGTLALDFSDNGLSLIEGIDFYDGNQPYSYDLNLTARPVPLPGAWLLLASALLFIKRR